MYLFLLDAMISSRGFPSWHAFPLQSLFLLDTNSISKFFSLHSLTTKLQDFYGLIFVFILGIFL
jgi:hypothetical protein